MTEAFTTVLEERTQNNIVRIRVNEMILFKLVVNKLFCFKWNFGSLAINANALPIEFPKCLAQSKTIPLNSTNLVRWDIMKAVGKGRECMALETDTQNELLAQNSTMCTVSNAFILSTLFKT